MDKEIGLSLREILNLEIFRDTKVIAGEKGLDKTVFNITIMEVPDIINWLKPRQLLVTTAYSIRNDIEAQHNLIPSLIEKDLAGLAIKPKRFIQEIPEFMIKQAENYGLPLLELSPEIIFSDLNNEVLQLIINRQNDYLNESLRAHRLFMDILLNGGGLSEMADCLAKIIENTVVIYDSKHEQKAYKVVNFDEHSFQTIITNEETFIPIKSAKPEKKNIYLDKEKLYAVQIPIVSGNNFFGKIIVCRTNRKITATDIQITERLAMVAAVQIINQHALTQLERRYANEFLDLLLFSNIESEADFINRGKFIGWDLDKPYAAVIIKYADKTGESSSFEKEKKRIEINNKIFKKIHELYAREEKSCIMGTKSDTLVLLLEIYNQDEKSLYKELLKEAKKLREALHLTVREGVLTISMGRYYDGVKGIQKSYKEAWKALNIGEKIGYEGKDIYFHQLGVFRLLALIDKKDDLEDFLNETINPLITYDQNKNTDLLKTLEMYFKYQGNMKTVSKKLFTHYNTVLYRLERIKKITKIDLADSEERLKLEIALKIYKMINR